MHTRNAMSFISTIDLQFDTYLFGIRTPFFISLFNSISLFGEYLFIIVLTALIGTLLWRFAAHRAYAAGLVTAVVGAGVSGTLLKLLIARARPSGLLPAIAETSYSFPSMHATLAMTFYGFTAYVLCTLYPAQRRSLLAAAVLIISAIGFSRLYLGVHFPSDVLAGYLLGGAWIFIGIRARAFFSRP
ncbi:MAG: phosphatase PAP2 family protein [Candidatus Pacebacteria bacterium]|nr:phosphatase PAP2 family protein [Candidatus Paceibacterota bacterium]